MKLKRKSLSKMNQAMLDKKQQQLIFGGNACKCGSCSGMTSDSANLNANYDSGITGTGTNTPACKCDGIVEHFRGRWEF